MSTYNGARSIDGENTLSLGSIDAPEPLVIAVEQWGKRRGVTRSQAVRILLAESMGLNLIDGAADVDSRSES